MDKIDKEIKKYTSKEQLWVKEILLRIKLNDLLGLDIKKIKNQEDVYRVRRGTIRIIFKIDKNSKKKLLSVSRRNEDTYKF